MAPSYVIAFLLRASTVNKNGERPTVMVVDDSDEIREVFRTQLEMLGYRVVEAADGQEAVELLRSEDPQLILMDLTMPRLDGFEATRLIREGTANPAIIIIACTCLNDFEMKRKALAAGCNDYVQKPLAMADLPSLLDRHLYA